MVCVEKFISLELKNGLFLPKAFGEVLLKILALHLFVRQRISQKLL